MATCYVCHKGTLKGHWVSHSNIKTRRFFKPNLHTLKVQFVDKKITAIKICSKCYKKLAQDFWAGKHLKFVPLSLLNQQKAKQKTALKTEPTKEPETEVKTVKKTKTTKKVKAVKQVKATKNGKEKGTKS